MQSNPRSHSTCIFLILCLEKVTLINSKIHSFKGGDVISAMIRTLSLDERDSNPSKLKSLDSGRKKVLQGSFSFQGTRTTLFSIQNSSVRKDGAFVRIDSQLQNPTAVKRKKVHRSFRIRRKHADCAVIPEQRWFRLLDLAMLNQSSYVDVGKQESVGSRWSRARTRAAKVGKGLSKDVKARKLALEHWLEAIDVPRHRYGHNLHIYYNCWGKCQSKQRFFYWLDVGDGKEVNLEQCSRLKLQQQCIKYLGPKERENYEVMFEDGKLIYKHNNQFVDSSGGDKESKWIFVLSPSKILYVGQKRKGRFQHSSFLAGAATLSAGRLVVEQGALKAIWPHSGHYRPTEENFQEFVSFLEQNNVDLTDVWASANHKQ